MWCGAVRVTIVATLGISRTLQHWTSRAYLVPATMVDAHSVRDEEDSPWTSVDQGGVLGWLVNWVELRFKVVVHWLIKLGLGFVV